MAAGIQKGDIIVGCDGTNIQSFAGLIAKLEGTDPGDTILLHIMRRNGDAFEEIKVPVATQ
jgi:S1-C subfamily serine protease